MSQQKIIQRGAKFFKKRLAIMVNLIFGTLGSLTKILLLFQMPEYNELLYFLDIYSAEIKQKKLKNYKKQEIISSIFNAINFAML